MKKMSRGFFKKTLINFLFVAIFCVAGFLISTISFGKNYVNAVDEYYEITSIYNDTEYDYIVKNSNKDFITELSSKEYVSKVVSYYNTLATITLNDEEVDIYIRSLDNKDDIYYTEFNHSRVLTSIDDVENSLYIGKTFANTYSLSLGDNIKIAGINFTVTKIYRDGYDNFVLYIPDFSNIISNKFDKKLDISGGYVMTDSNESLVKFLNDKSVDYIDKFENYDIEIQSANEKVEYSKNEYITFGILVGVFCLIGSVLYLTIDSKKRRNEIVNNGRKEVFVRINVAHILLVVIASLMIFASYYAMCTFNNSHLSISQYFTNTLLGILIICISVILGWVINLFIAKVEKK